MTKGHDKASGIWCFFISCLLAMDWAWLGWLTLSPLPPSLSSSLILSSELVPLMKDLGMRCRPSALEKLIAKVGATQPTNQTKQTKAKPSQIKLNQIKPSQAKPAQPKPSQPSPTQPSPTEPNRTQSSPAPTRSLPNPAG